jgi:OCT family organic cation transporter-like MFS transporter 4/5
MESFFSIITSRFIPESPRWLLRNQRIEEATQVLRKISKTNGVKTLSLTSETLKAVADQECSGSSQTRFSYLSFFREPELRRKSIILMGIWFSWAVVYYGLSFNVKNLSGNPYLNMFLMGVSDAVGYPAALLLNNRSVF